MIFLGAAIIACVHSKICSSCEEEKDLEEFHKDRNRPDGRRSACKLCRSQRNNKPDAAQLPPEPPPPVDPHDLDRLARSRAIKDVIEAHPSEFQRRYAFHLDILGVQSRWHALR